MSSKLILFTLSILFLSSTLAKEISFTDCGAGEIKKVTVEPCESEPCMFKKGEKVTITATGVSSKDSPSGQLKVTVNFGGVEVDYPGIDPDLCHKVDCPIKKGQKYTLTYELDVEDYFPDVSSLVRGGIYCLIMSYLPFPLS